MPTPTAFNSGAASNTRQAMPARCSISPSVKPPMPAPMMMTSMASLPLTGRARDDHAPQAATAARKNESGTS